MDREGGRHAGHEQIDLESDLIDLSGLGLDRLNTLDDETLVGSLRRLVEECATQPAQFTQFMNAIVPRPRPSHASGSQHDRQEQIG